MNASVFVRYVTTLMGKMNLHGCVVLRYTLFDKYIDMFFLTTDRCLEVSQRYITGPKICSIPVCLILKLNQLQTVSSLI